MVELRGEVPPEHVPAPVAAERETAVPHGEVDRPAGAVELLGDLAAGVARADDEDGARRERVGIPVSPGMDLVNVGGQPAAIAGTRGTWYEPVATTTFAATSVPADVRRENRPSGSAATAETATPSRTGKAKTAA